MDVAAWKKRFMPWSLWPELRLTVIFGRGSLQELRDLWWNRTGRSLMWCKQAATVSCYTQPPLPSANTDPWGLIPLWETFGSLSPARLPAHCSGQSYDDDLWAASDCWKVDRLTLSIVIHFSVIGPPVFFLFFFWLGFKKSVLCKKVNRSLWKKSLTHTQTHTAHPCACTQIHNLHSTHMPAACWHNTPGSKPFVNCATVHHEAITQSINWSPEIKRKWYSITDGGKTTNIRLSVLLNLKDLHGFLYVCVFWMNIDVITCDRRVMFIV